MRECMIVDGYNIINNWKLLKEESLHSLDSARTKLLDIMSNYQSYKGIQIIVVFDAHYVKNNMGKHEMYDGIHVIYTKESESADNYIERFVAEKGDEFSIIKVATSDYLEQRVILGLGGARISARELEKEVNHTVKRMDKCYMDKAQSMNALENNLDLKILKKLEKIRRQKS